MMEPNHRSSNKKQTIATKMHELSQCSDTNFVTTQTQGTWPALREWEDLKLLIPKVSLTIETI